MLITLIQERDGKVEATALEPEWQKLLFQPGAHYTWHDVEEETLLSICLVSAPEAS
jgi:hypothetical protein